MNVEYETCHQPTSFVRPGMHQQKYENLPIRKAVGNLTEQHTEYRSR